MSKNYIQIIYNTLLNFYFTDNVLFTPSDITFCFMLFLIFLHTDILFIKNLSSYHLHLYIYQYIKHLLPYFNYLFQH